MQDMSYRRFQQKLLPTVSSETIIGIRTPVLRSFAKEFAKTPDAKKFKGGGIGARYVLSFAQRDRKSVV